MRGTKKIIKPAFTLIEIIIVVLIVGIAVSIALPRFSRALEMTRAREAIAALRQIRTGQRIYRGELRFYFPEDDPPDVDPETETDIARINEFLHIFLEERNWDFTITATADAFTATAQRIGGVNNGEQITIDQTGQVDDQTGWSP